jgi:hypothetical protein
MPATELDPNDVRASLHARQELGHEFDAAVAESFVDRVSHVIDARIEARLATPLRRDHVGDRTPLVLAVTSLAAGIPITAIAGFDAGAGGISIVWLGIAAVNIAYRFRR